MKKLLVVAGFLGLIAQGARAQTAEQVISQARKDVAAAGAESSAKTKVCSKFMECGIFAGPGSATDAKGAVVDQFYETTTITALADDQARLDMVIGAESYHLLFAFQDSGQFTVTSEKSGSLYASGICKDSVCTYGMIPFSGGGDGITGNVGILRFANGKLERYMWVVSPTETRNQFSALWKRPEEQK